MWILWVLYDEIRPIYENDNIFYRFISYKNIYIKLVRKKHFGVYYFIKWILWGNIISRWCCLIIDNGFGASGKIISFLIRVYGNMYIQIKNKHQYCSPLLFSARETHWNTIKLHSNSTLIVKKKKTICIFKLCIDVYITVYLLYV